ncbi:hypothetical protein J7E70_03905 [Variovorax paradoxus]|nr:hypothetical protein [Variovorax paradoxus]
MPIDPSTPISDGHSFAYRGFRFSLRAEPMNGSMFRPVAVLVDGPVDLKEAELPNDTDEVAYRTEAEALRHAEQQAMRWVHDRTDTGQAQF